MVLPSGPNTWAQSLGLGEQGCILLLPLHKQAKHLPRVYLLLRLLPLDETTRQGMGSDILSGHTRGQVRQHGNVGVNTPGRLLPLLSISKSFSSYGLHLSIFIILEIKSEKTFKYLLIDFKHQQTLIVCKHK